MADHVKPYYQRNGITLYHGDCREVLPHLPHSCVDLIVTDPPYGVRWRSNYRAERFAEIAGDDSADAALEGIRLALPALRVRRHIYAFGRYDFSSLPVVAGAELIWDKGQFSAGDLESVWGTQHEYIQFLVNFPSAAHREKGRGGLTSRMRRGTILRHQRPGGTGVADHPTEKPVMLLRELIESSSCIGETVLDPFAGIGSTLVAAQLEARNAIGIELEERYCEVAARRLSEGVNLFSATLESAHA